MNSSQENEFPEPQDTPHLELISDGAAPSEGILYVGIDMGTSRTSIAASNGVRATVASVVGYPKDVVGQKLFGRSVLFGDEAIEKRMSLDFHRPLEKGVLKGTNGAEGDVAPDCGAGPLGFEHAERLGERIASRVVALVRAALDRNAMP